MFSDIILGISSNDIVAGSELGLFIATAISVIIAAILVCLTRKNVQVATKLVEMQSNPFVYIMAEWDEFLASRQARGFYIFIENSGGGIARNIKFGDITGDFQVISSIEMDMSTATPDRIVYTTFKQLPIIEEGIKELAPHQKILLVQFELGRIHNIKNSTKITFEYENVLGERKQGEDIIDFPSYARSLERH